jgi:hypothetical protein
MERTGINWLSKEISGRRLFNLFHKKWDFLHRSNNESFEQDTMLVSYFVSYLQLKDEL